MNSIQKPESKISLLRLDDCTWSFPRAPKIELSDSKKKEPEIDEIRIETPNLSKPGQAYELALLVANVLQNSNGFFQIQKEESVYFEIEKHQGSLNGKWVMTLEKEKGFGTKMIEWIPFAKKYPPHHFAAVKVAPIDPDKVSSVTARVKDWVMNRNYLTVDGKLNYSPIYCSLNAQESFAERMKRPAFTDPFTRMATIALQNIETNFVSENLMQGSCRLVAGNDGQLTIDLVSLKNDPTENQRTIRLYHDFLLKEYGQEFIDYAQYAYGFNFREMIDRGLPLLPDHVFKMNVGVNNIEMGNLENLYKRLNLMRLDLTLHPSDASTDQILESYFQSNAPVRFSIRELKKLKEIMNEEVHDDETLKDFLNRLIGDVIPDHLPHLMPEQFNILIRMLWPSSEEISRALTGRKITHLAICGYKTMGNPNEADPSRDQAELMQIYADLERREDWENFYELIAHVAVKKNLFRKHHFQGSESLWQTGVVLPAPQTKDGQKRWYCVCRARDNGAGNLSYILLPAVKGFRKDGRPLPMIHLYRSTNSDRNAIDSVGSIENDLNPFTSPGSLGDVGNVGLKGGFFFNRTIPLWVAMMIHGDNQPKDLAIYNYRDALDEYELAVKRGDLYCSIEKKSVIDRLKNSNHATEIRSFLADEAENKRELPKYKREQDLVLIGHSLGGALAQRGFHYFGPGMRRIPCPGFHFICRSYNGPATDASVDREFMEFGRKYREVIQGLGQQWKIFHQFEYGDFVPEAGECHLGSNNYSEEYDEEWLHVHTQIFQPKETAHALAITTCPTHGRRISLAVKNLDYQLNFITPKELYDYHHSIVLPKKLIDLFGYRILISPRTTELLRRTIGCVGYPLLRIGTAIYHTFHPENVQRDAQGVFSCEYHAAQLQPEVWPILSKR